MRYNHQHILDGSLHNSQVSFVQTFFSQETSVNGRIFRLIVIEIAGLIQFFINSWQQEYGL